MEGRENMCYSFRSVTLSSTSLSVRVGYSKEKNEALGEISKHASLCFSFHILHYLNYLCLGFQVLN